MAIVHNSLRNSIHTLMTTRVAPKLPKKQAAATSTASSTTTSDAAADFRALFTSRWNPPTPVVPNTNTTPPLPTAQAVFGPNPWVSNPGGMAPNGVAYSYNPAYFATRATADKLAQMYGGTVVEMDAITPYGPFQQNQKNEMIRFSNGNVVNAGILASYFDRGMTQAQIDEAIAGEIKSTPT